MTQIFINMNTPLDPKLEKLLTSKSFLELSSSERRFVLTQISEIEYSQYHEFLYETIGSFDSIERHVVLSSNIQSNLSDTFKKTYAKPFFKPLHFPYLNITLPYYQPLLLSIVILIGVYISLPIKTSKNQFSSIEETTKTSKKNQTIIFSIPTIGNKAIISAKKLIPSPKKNQELVKNTAVLHTKKQYSLTDDIFIKNTQFEDLVIELHEYNMTDKLTRELETMSFNNPDLTLSN